jgi:hypothetical protein
MDPVPIPKEVQEVFSRYAHEDGKMDASKLLEFLHKEQGELKATLQEAEQLLQQQNQQQQIHSQELKIDDFFQFLCNGSLNAVLYTAVNLFFLCTLDLSNSLIALRCNASSTVSQLVVAAFGNQDQCFWLNFYATFLIRFVFSVWGVGYFWVLYLAGSSRHDTTCVSLLHLHWSQFVSHWESAQQRLQCGPHH